MTEVHFIFDPQLPLEGSLETTIKFSATYRSLVQVVKFDYCIRMTTLHNARQCVKIKINIFRHISRSMLDEDSREILEMIQYVYFIFNNMGFAFSLVITL